MLVDHQLHGLYAKLKHNHREAIVYWIIQVLRSAHAVKCNEACRLLPQSDIGFRQFECEDPNDRYADPPVVTLYENGTWERV